MWPTKVHITENLNMKKLIFYQAYFYIFFPIYKNVNWILSEKRKASKKDSWKVSKSLRRLKKTKSENMVVNDIKNFLKRKKIKGVSMNVNAIKISLQMKNKGYLNTK